MYNWIRSVFKLNTEVLYYSANKMCYRKVWYVPSEIYYDPKFEKSTLKKEIVIFSP